MVRLVVTEGRVNQWFCYLQLHYPLQSSQLVTRWVVLFVAAGSYRTKTGVELYQPLMYPKP